MVGFFFFCLEKFSGVFFLLRTTGKIEADKQKCSEDDGESINGGFSQTEKRQKDLLKHRD